MDWWFFLDSVYGYKVGFNPRSFVTKTVNLVMCHPARQKIGKFEWKRRDMNDEWEVILLIHQYDDGYEEYEVFSRCKTSDDRLDVDLVFHGYDLSSAIGDFNNRSSVSIANL